MHKVLMGTALITASAAATFVAGQGAAVAQAPKQAADPAPSSASCDQPNDPLLSFAAINLAKPGPNSGNCSSATSSSY